MTRVCHSTVLLLLSLSCFAQKRAAVPLRGPEPTGPLAVFDTTAGRITCRLYAKQAPKTTANFIALAEGTKDWHDALNLTTVHGKPFYDGTALAGITDGIRGGDRFGGGEGPAGAPIARETIPGVTFDRPGRLAMATHQGEISSSFFLITLHADDEFDKIVAKCVGEPEFQEMGLRHFYKRVAERHALEQDAKAMKKMQKKRIRDGLFETASVGAVAQLLWDIKQQEKKPERLLQTYSDKIRLIYRPAEEVDDEVDGMIDGGVKPGSAGSSR